MKGGEKSPGWDEDAILLAQRVGIVFNRPMNIQHQVRGIPKIATRRIITGAVVAAISIGLTVMVTAGPSASPAPHVPRPTPGTGDKGECIDNTGHVTHGVTQDQCKKLGGARFKVSGKDAVDPQTGDRL